MKPFLSVALACALALPSLAHAADSLDGIWRLDNVKSFWTNGKMPKNMSLTIQVDFKANTLNYYSVNDTFPGKRFVLRYEIPMDGKNHPIPDHGPKDRYNAMNVRRLDDHQFLFMKMKGDDVVVGEFWQYSADGKHLVRRGVGKSIEGTSKAFIEYFDRTDKMP